jgi:hypothetical protein
VVTDVLVVNEALAWRVFAGRCALGTVRIFSVPYDASASTQIMRAARSA